MANQSGSSSTGGGDDSDPLLRVAILYTVVVVDDQWAGGDEKDLAADQEVAATAQGIAEGLRSKGYTVDMVPVTRLAEVAPALAGFDPATTLVFNLCECPGGEATDEARAAQILQDTGFRYTGASPYTLATCLDKARTKRILQAHSIPTAPFQVCRSGRAPARVPMPAIVKPLAEDGSVGINRDSVVTSPVAMRRQVAYVLEAYRQPALVEAYISGREFNVSVWGNGVAHVLPLAELEFGDWPELAHVCHFEAKWDSSAPEYNTTYVTCPVNVPPELHAAITHVALRAYQILGCCDYARVDMRVKDGIPYVLEVNPNPCLALDAGFPRAAAAAGYDYQRMLSQIVKWAWDRPRKSKLRKAA